MDDFRAALSEELSELSAPPLTGLVEAAARDGRRVRRRRTVTAAAGSVTALAVAVGLLTGLAGRAGHQVTAPASAASAPEGPSSGMPLDVTPSGRLVPTTSRALLARVIDLMPPDALEVGDIAVGSDGATPTVQLNRTDERGIGVVRVTLLAGPGIECTPAGGQGCAMDSAGQAVKVDTFTTPCPQTTVVTVVRSDGNRAQVLYGNCRYGESPNAFVPGVAALSVGQATALAGSPTLSLHTDSALVDAADKKFRDLPSLL